MNTLIETDRLYITEMTMDMVMDVHKNSLDEDIRRFVPDEVFETLEDAKETVEFLMSQYGSADGPLVYAVILKDGDKNIGYVQLVPIGEGRWEIGYHIAKPYTCKGYATEAVTAFLPVIAEKVGIDEVYGIRLLENAASGRVLDKCGFEAFFAGEGEYHGGVYEISKSIWKKEDTEMKDALAAIKDRSSTRKYTGEKLTKEEISTIVRAGLMAPTAANRQELHFTVVDGSSPILKELHEEMLKTRPNANAAVTFYYDAPVFILVSAKEDFFWSPVDAGIAVENMAIAAEAMGLGSLIIGCIRDAMNGEKRAYFSEAFKLPEGYKYQIAFAVGHKAAEKVPHEYNEEQNVTYL